MNSSNIINLENDRIVTTTISHELKTPLNAIIGFTDLILEEECLNRIKDYADIIKDNSRVLLEKIHKVIYYNTLELDSSIFLERVEVGEMIIRGAKIIREEFGRCGKEIHIANNALYIDSGTIFYTDRIKLEKLFCLLLSSATYLNKSGKIVIDYILTSEAFSLILSIDQKETKENEDLNNGIFEEGVGINMALCDKLSKLVGGKMNLRFDRLAKNIELDIPFRNRYRDSKSCSAQKILLVVDDDDESFAKIKRLIPGSSYLVLRTTESCFREGMTESLSKPGIVVVNGADTGEELKEPLRRVRESNPNASFLINVANTDCIKAFSHNYQNVLWFKPSTLKSQIEKLIKT